MAPSTKRMVRQSLLLLRDEGILLILGCSWMDLLCHRRHVTAWEAPSSHQIKSVSASLAIRGVNRADVGVVGRLTDIPS